MELVYLWVEKYKNIEKQGFNFSPRFRCEYDEDTKKLTIDENKDYVSIFPEKINITAIVGENGSGKSSLIKFLMKAIFNKSSSKDSSKFFIIIEEEGKLELYHNNIDDINTNYSKYNIFNEEIQKKLKKIFFQFIDFSLTNNILNSDKEYKENFAAEPSTEYLGGGPGYTSKVPIISFDSLMMGKSISLYKLIDDELLNNLNIEKFDRIKLSGTRYNKKSNPNNFQKEIDLLNEFYKKNPTESLLNFFTKKKFEECLKLRNFNKLRNSNGDDKRIKLSDISDLDLQYLSILDRFVTIELINDKKISYRDLSGGHKIFIGYFALIYKQLQIILREKKKNNFFIIIDEIETALHPKWQKSIMNFLIKSLEKVIKNENISIHIIPITHSPFVISDLAKENVIFLERLENGDCKNVSKEININPFGANIHTLLSHGFFMKEGLMGEFAKSKIDEVIKYLNNDKKSSITNVKEAQNIINIIGEPIIKKELQRMLKNKTELESHENVAKIQDEIEVLKKRIEELEKEKHNVSQ